MERLWGFNFISYGEPSWHNGIRLTFPISTANPTSLHRTDYLYPAACIQFHVNYLRREFVTRDANGLRKEVQVLIDSFIAKAQFSKV